MKQKGFTLVEMIIVITCVIILSTISVPIYKDYIRQARIAEGYALAASLRDAQYQYFAEYGKFLDGINSSTQDRAVFTSCEPILGVSAIGNKYFTAFLVNRLSNFTQFTSTILGKGGAIFVEGNSNKGTTIRFEN